MVEHFQGEEMMVRWEAPHQPYPQWYVDMRRAIKRKQREHRYWTVALALVSFAWGAACVTVLVVLA